MDLYRLGVLCHVPFCEKPRICRRFSADFRVICAQRKTASIPHRLNLAAFPIPVIGSNLKRAHFRKNSSAQPDFWIFENSHKSCFNYVTPILFSTLRGEGSQWPAASAISAPSLSLSRFSAFANSSCSSAPASSRFPVSRAKSPPPFPPSPSRRPPRRYLFSMYLPYYSRCRQQFT